MSGKNKDRKGRKARRAKYRDVEGVDERLRMVVKAPDPFRVALSAAGIEGMLETVAVGGGTGIELPEGKAFDDDGKPLFDGPKAVREGGLVILKLLRIEGKTARPFEIVLGHRDVEKLVELLRETKAFFDEGLGKHGDDETNGAFSAIDKPEWNDVFSNPTGATH